MRERQRSAGSAAIASYFPVALERVATALVIFVLGCVTAGIGVFSSDPHALRLQVPRPVYWVVGVAGTWNWNDIIMGQPVAPEPALPGRAADAVALWTNVTDTFERMVDGFSDDDLREEVEAWGGRVERAFLVSHVVAEVLHHAAEVGRLRDLYRNRHTISRS